MKTSFIVYYAIGYPEMSIYETSEIPWMCDVIHEHDWNELTEEYRKNFLYFLESLPFGRITLVPNQKYNILKVYENVK